MGKNSKYSNDINLLVSQSNRSNEILKSLTLNPHIKDEFLKNKLSLNDYLSAIILSYEEISEKKFILINKDDNFSIKFNRSLEINYGLRNFIGNANKFSNYSIEVTIKSDEKFSEILIQDDGPGFPEDIIDKLGEPYIRASSNKDESKTGLN